MIIWLMIIESWLFPMVYRVISKTPFNWFFILFLKPLLYLRISIFGACRTCISRNCITGVILITVLLSNKVFCDTCDMSPLSCALKCSIRSHMGPYMGSKTINQIGPIDLNSFSVQFFRFSKVSSTKYFIN